MPTALSTPIACACAGADAAARGRRDCSPISRRRSGSLRQAVYNWSRRLRRSASAAKRRRRRRPRPMTTTAGPLRVPRHDAAGRDHRERLQAYSNVEASPALAHERRSRLLHASFIVEFGLEHGLPDRDHTSESMLKEFLVWASGRAARMMRPCARSCSSPGGPGAAIARHAADWFDDHKGALIGGAILGGAIGVLVAGRRSRLRARRPKAEDDDMASKRRRKVSEWYRAMASGCVVIAPAQSQT